MRIILLIMIGLSTGLLADFSKSNGVVTHSKTILQWQDDYSDNGNSIKQATWTAAIDYCEGLNLDGGGWRLPNKKELLSIVDYSRHNPAIDTIFANTTSSHYWSSTTHANYTSNAWIVYFGNGNTKYYHKSNSFYVRCVR